MLWLLSMVFAYPSGTFIRQESAAQTKEAHAKALEETLSASNFLVRNAARKRLADRPYSCTQYRIKSYEDRLEINCDQRPTFVIRLDGTVTTYKGKKIEVHAADGRIEQYIGTKKGGIKIIYTFQKDGFSVQKIIQSRHLGKDLAIQNTYKIQP